MSDEQVKNAENEMSDADMMRLPIPDLGPIELKVNPLLVSFEGPAVAIGVSILVPADREDFAMHTLNVMGAALASNDGKLVLNTRTGVNVVYDVDRKDDVQEVLSLVTDEEGEQA